MLCNGFNEITDIQKCNQRRSFLFCILTKESTQSMDCWSDLMLQCTSYMCNELQPLKKRDCKKKKKKCWFTNTFSKYGIKCTTIIICLMPSQRLQDEKRWGVSPMFLRLFFFPRQYVPTEIISISIIPGQNKIGWSKRVSAWTDLTDAKRLFSEVGQTKPDFGAKS